MPRIQENYYIPGTIRPFAGGTVPLGYLLCDGTSLLRNTYKALFAAIGTNWGAVDGSHFNLPDLRGRFLRGRDGGIGRDPDRGSRTACNSGGNTGDNVGSIQGQATAKNSLSNSSGSISVNSVSGVGDHDHSVNTDGPYRTKSGAGGGVYHPSYTLTGGGNNSDGGGSHSHNYSGSTSGQTISSDSETRPINAYVLYIIKY